MNSKLSKNSNFFQALAILTGTIIGVGLFSLPYITAKVGIFTMLVYFLVLGAVTSLIGLFYGEIALRTKGLHRLPGYAGKYLGKRAKVISFISNTLGLTGAILAYLIIGGRFLGSIFQSSFGGSDFVYVFIFFLVGAILTYFGIGSIAKAESFLFILFFFILGFIFYKGFWMIDAGNLLNFNIEYLFLPYGAILFSLSGTTLIPEVKEILSKDPKKLKKLILLAISIAAITYLFFIFLILGITGQGTSDDAITGLSNFLGNEVIVFALLFGILTVFTSFLTISLTLKKILWYDLRLKKNLAWLIACIVPLILFIIGFDNFITVIALTGGVMLGIDVVIITLIYLKAKTKGDLEPAYSLSIPSFFVYFLILFFIIGIIYEIVYFIK
ncbi:MAG: aromatic amino acid transport family protein [Patescibacteria group bacterium]|nr:amino acid permease [Patescibacteria group bacterium]